MIGARAGVTTQTYHDGLEGLVAGDTTISHVDGAKGRLSFRGHSVADLAARCSFEEVSHLVLFGRLPTPEQLGAWSAELDGWRQPPPAALEALRHVPELAHPLAKYRTMLTVAACVAPSVERREDDLAWRRPDRKSVV